MVLADVGPPGRSGTLYRYRTCVQDSPTTAPHGGGDPQVGIPHNLHGAERCLCAADACFQGECDVNAFVPARCIRGESSAPAFALPCCASIGQWLAVQLECGGARDGGPQVASLGGFAVL